MRSESTNAPILILGGTNFMGIAAIDKLCKDFPDSQIFSVNRGRIYWKNQVYKDHPELKHFYGDRKEHREMGKAIQYLSEKLDISEQNKWRAVIDFSCFRWRELQSVVKALHNKTQIYVFISSDSVYNNSPYNGVPIKEENFSIQDAYKSLKGKKVEDQYGYNKLKCEVYLQRTKYVPNVNLRLPDVIGPYDNTERFWCSLEWVNCSKLYPIELIEKDKSMPLSFVYSKDVAETITNLVKNNEQIPKHSSFNIACSENPTYKDLMQQIALTRSQIQNSSKAIELNFKQISHSQSNGMYPSTNYTCIDCELASKVLGFSATPLKTVLLETCKFFLERACEYSREYKEMKKEFKDKIQLS